MDNDQYEPYQWTNFRLNPTFEWLMTKSLDELKDLADKHGLDAKKWWDKSVYAIELTELAERPGAAGQEVNGEIVLEAENV